ncbi:MAG: hypothetical protein NZ937_03340 [Armatimonadetes bacterium]|nr:hypothetical protein [Armatimonadota bacterium]
MLTVWRRLFVEIDSMGIVNDEERLKHEDDLLTGDVPDPNITPDPDGTGFERAFEQCYIRAIVASQYNQSNTPWHHHFESKAAEEAYAKQHRNSLPEANDLWFVYAIGMYDPPENPNLGYYPTDDNDPEVDANNYPALIGRTHGGEKEAVIGPAAEPEYSFCYIEVLQDVAKEWGWYQGESKWMTDKVCHVLRVVTLHESVHHFDFMTHNEQPNSVMWAPSTNAGENMLSNIPLLFAPKEIQRIRQTKRP